MTRGGGTPVARPGEVPEYRYHLLRAALGDGRPGLAGLPEQELSDLARKADRTFELEALVLGSPEAMKVVIPASRLDEALAEVRGRYPDREAFLADLEGNGLTEEVLRGALHRELIFDTTMQRIGARRPMVSDIDERLFFELHRERFTQPERRTARHLLITVNEAIEENRREVARARIERLAEQLAGRAHRFPRLAHRHSECPSALEDGRLGEVQRGQLFPTLDAALFGLGEGEVSGPVESELGYHLLWCEKVHAGQILPFSKAWGRIRELLEARAARNCQKAWIGELRRGRGLGAPGVQ